MLIPVESGIGTGAELYGVRILDVSVTRKPFSTSTQAGGPLLQPQSSHQEPAGVPIHGCFTAFLQETIIWFYRPAPHPFLPISTPLALVEAYLLPFLLFQLLHLLPEAISLDSQIPPHSLTQPLSPHLWLQQWPLSPSFRPTRLGNVLLGFSQPVQGCTHYSSTCLFQGYVTEPPVDVRSQNYAFSCVYMGLYRKYMWHIRIASASTLAP